MATSASGPEPVVGATPKLPPLPRAEEIMSEEMTMTRGVKGKGVREVCIKAIHGSTLQVLFSSTLRQEGFLAYFIQASL